LGLLPVRAAAAAAAADIELGALSAVGGSELYRELASDARRRLLKKLPIDILDVADSGEGDTRPNIATSTALGDTPAPSLLAPGTWLVSAAAAAAGLLGDAPRAAVGAGPSVCELLLVMLRELLLGPRVANSPEGAEWRWDSISRPVVTSVAVPSPRMLGPDDAGSHSSLLPCCCCSLLLRRSKASAAAGAAVEVQEAPSTTQEGSSREGLLRRLLVPFLPFLLLRLRLFMSSLKRLEPFICCSVMPLPELTLVTAPGATTAEVDLDAARRSLPMLLKAEPSPLLALDRASAKPAEPLAAAKLMAEGWDTSSASD
jgi:hypothetical protein